MTYTKSVSVLSGKPLKGQQNEAPHGIDGTSRQEGGLTSELPRLMDSPITANGDTTTAIEHSNGFGV